ncbi:MAG: Flp family type IVb pilin [Acidobacteriaceae bacterium]|jgi:pilus assembly protein Flp/PilA
MMKNMKQLLKNLATEDSGQDLIEYALVAALVGLGAVASLNLLRNTIANTLGVVDNQLINATA